MIFFTMFRLLCIIHLYANCSRVSIIRSPRTIDFLNTQGERFDDTHAVGEGNGCHNGVDTICTKDSISTYTHESTSVYSHGLDSTPTNALTNMQTNALTNMQTNAGTSTQAKGGDTSLSINSILKDPRKSISKDPRKSMGIKFNLDQLENVQPQNIQPVGNITQKKDDDKPKNTASHSKQFVCNPKSSKNILEQYKDFTAAMALIQRDSQDDVEDKNDNVNVILPKTLDKLQIANKPNEKFVFDLESKETVIEQFRNFQSRISCELENIDEVHNKPKMVRSITFEDFVNDLSEGISLDDKLTSCTNDDDEDADNDYRKRFAIRIRKNASAEQLDLVEKDMQNDVKGVLNNADPTEVTTQKKLMHELQMRINKDKSSHTANDDEGQVEVESDLNHKECENEFTEHAQLDCLDPTDNNDHYNEDQQGLVGERKAKDNDKYELYAEDNKTWGLYTYGFLTLHMRSVLIDFCVKKISDIHINEEIRNKITPPGESVYTRLSKYVWKTKINPIFYAIQDLLVKEAVTNITLFRTSGVKSKVQDLCNLMMTNKPYNLANYELNTLASAYKHYIRNILDGIIPSSIVEHLVYLGSKHRYCKENRQHHKIIARWLPSAITEEKREILLKIFEIHRLIKENKKSTEEHASGFITCIASTICNHKILTEFTYANVPKELVKFMADLEYEGLGIPAYKEFMYYYKVEFPDGERLYPDQ